MPVAEPPPISQTSKDSPPMSAKRKRSASENGGEVSLPATNGINHSSDEIHEWLKDVLIVLKRNESASSLLDRDLTPSTSDKPSPKRQKTSGTIRMTIEHKINGQSYETVGELVSDLDTAIAGLCEELQTKNDEGDLSSLEQQKRKEKAYTVKARLQALIKNEQFLRPKTFSKMHAVSAEHGENTSTSEVKNANKTILTLFGGERHARQLFSSLPKPTSADITNIPLPNGITFTDVVPVHSQSDNRDKVPTLGESFPPPSTLKQVNPPRPSSSRHTATRSLSVHWHNPTEIPTATKEATARDPYFRQSLPTGRWLTYNVAPSTDQMTSPNAKRRHRDRALSTGEPQSAIDAETSAAHAQVKDDALFRSVYSSFAPTRDDYGAVVSQEQKNRIWWLKHGEERFHQALRIREDELFGPYELESEFEEDAIDDKLVEEELAKMDNASPDDVATEKQEQIPGAEGLLAEISELLEVLHSHQRIRNLSHSTSSRPLQGQKEPSSAIPHDHLSASDRELEVYESLRSQLATVISDLPPYLLAKVDGEKLGALSLNTKIRIPGRYQRGILQPDNVVAKPRVAAPYAPVNPAPASSRGAYSSTPNQQYTQRPAYGQTSATRPTGTGYSTYSAPRPTAGASQYTGTQPRPSYSHPQYTQTPQQRASSYVDRFNSGQLVGGGGSAAGGVQTPQYSTYSQNYRPQLGQQTYSGPAYTPQPSSQRIAQASTPAAVAAAGQGYVRTPGTMAPNYSYRHVPTPPAASVSPNPMPTHGGAFGSQYAPPGANSGQRPPLYHQHSSHYGAGKSPPPPQVNGVGGPGRMSPAAGMGVPQGVKQRSHTPQMVGHGQTGGQNGTPGPKENGVTT